MSAGYMRRCAGKKRYLTKDEATGARAALVAKTGREFSQYQVYQCDQCLGHHIGGASNRMRSRLRTGKRANKRMRGR